MTAELNNILLILAYMAAFALMLFFNAKAILGFHYATDEDEMILTFIRDWFEKIKAPWWITKPVYACPTCMSSLHSTYFFIPFALLTDVRLFYIYPLYILTLAGLSTILARYSNYLLQEGKEAKEITNVAKGIHIPTPATSTGFAD